MTTLSTQRVPILDSLAKGDILVLDGATGTYLQDHGLEPGGCPELFNIHNQATVKQMAADYFNAGSDIILTNTFGGNRFMLTKYGFGNMVSEINRSAVECARSAAPSDKFVCGSVGPTGEFMEPLGTVSSSQMYDVLTEQISALAEGGADAVMIETQLGLEEASIAIRTAKENTNLIVMATMVFDLGPRGYFSMMGVTPEQAVKGLKDAGADVVGSNCGNGIDKMLEVGRSMRNCTTEYLAIESNAGIPKITKKGTVYPETPEYMADRYRKLLDLPINVLGGCCGTTPAHIEALRRVVDESGKAKQRSI